ncbi:MAG: hypothetical protein ACI30J_03145 [Paludibacteraceae bacterium]
MKQILHLKELYGSQIRTRQLVEQLAQTLNESNQYLLDMEGVEVLSRSAADELCTIKQRGNIEIVNASSFVQKMLDVVTISRFLPRQRQENGYTQIIECKTIESAIAALQ